MKIIKINNCAECPYRKWRAVKHTSINYCGIYYNDPLDIKDITIIPDWCPLEELKKSE